ncbi:unnamed protein product [Staurois parvus]|uniref:Uncharacterized protein n=1 Tax=Staurois parvus TaxID=386267 RepID=A0ABN9HT60_9NEOB|nr:unnamed protein product [Staurois parvus]
MHSLVISCTVSVVSGHLLYNVRSPGHLLYYIRSLWSRGGLTIWALGHCLRAWVRPCSGHLLYYVCTPLVQIFFLLFSSSKI